MNFYQLTSYYQGKGKNLFQFEFLPHKWKNMIKLIGFYLSPAGIRPLLKPLRNTLGGS